MTDTTAFELTLNADSSGWNGYTLLVVFNVVGLTLPAGAISKIRITFQGPASGSGTGTNVGNCYVGHAAASGDAYDFDTTPVQVKFGGNNNVSVTRDGTVVSDWMDFAYNKTSNLVIPYYIQSADDVIRYRTGQSNKSTYFRLGNHSATVDKSSFTILSGDVYLISKIEVRSSDGDGGGFLIYW